MPQRKMNRPLRIEWAGAGTGAGGPTNCEKVGSRVHGAIPVKDLDIVYACNED